MTLAVKNKKIPAEQRIEHERLTSLINSMADAVVAVDERGKVVLYNGATLNIFDVNTIREGCNLSSLFEAVDTNNQPVDIQKMVLDTKVPTTNRDLLLR